MTKTATEKTNTPAQQKLEDYTLTSGILIHGANLLPQKMIAIMDYFYSNIRTDTGVKSIIVRDDNRPTKVLGKAYPWAYSFVLNVPYHLERVYARLSEKDFGLNLKDAVWLALLESWLHETIHVHMATADESWFEGFVNAGSKEDEKDIEQTVKELAREALIELARTVDIEGPAVEGMGALGGLLMEKFLLEKDDFIDRSKIMLEQDIVYSDETGEDKIYHETLRSFVRNCLVATGDDEEWDNVNLVNLSFVMENGEETIAQAEPVVDTEAIIAEATAEALEQVYPETIADEVEEESGQDMEAVLRAVEGQTAEAVLGATQQAAAPIAAAQPALQPAAVITSDGEEFQLPAHLTAATGQVAANMAPQPATEHATPLPKLDIPIEKMKGCLQEVYMHLYNQLFLKCGWSQDPATGRYQFPNPYAITASWQVGNILQRWGCEGLIAEYTSYAEGMEITPTTRASAQYTCDGFVRGFVYGDKNLPAFELFLNINGDRVKRRLIPQNPNKIVNNAYTKGAEQAAAGNAVMYIFSEATSDRPWHERCPAKIENKQYKEQTA